MAVVVASVVVRGMDQYKIFSDKLRFCKMSQGRIEICQARTQTPYPLHTLCLPPFNSLFFGADYYFRFSVDYLYFLIIQLNGIYTSHNASWRIRHIKLSGILRYKPIT